MKVISINLLPISLLYLCVKFKTTQAKQRLLTNAKQQQTAVNIPSWNSSKKLGCGSEPGKTAD